MGATRQLDNFLPQPLFQKLLASAKEVRWKWGAKSNSETDEHGHWSLKPFYDAKHNLAELANLNYNHPLMEAWKFIVDKHLPSFKLIRCYWNGYTYGTDGYFHTDAREPGQITGLIFVVPEWEDDWAGETVVKPNECCIPAPNRAFFFPSHFPHVGRAVSRKCLGLRTVAVLKARAAYSAEAEALSSWLVSRGSLQFKHGNGSLHDHLLRCYLACEKKLLPREVCRAAGLHSIYGTNAFRHKLFEPTSQTRTMIRNVWGRYCENLIMSFANMDRPKVLDKDFTNNPTGLHLQLVEAANLEDQGSLEKWPNIKKAWENANCKDVHLPAVQPQPQTDPKIGSVGGTTSTLSPLSRDWTAAGL